MIKKIALFCMLPLFLATNLMANNFYGCPDHVLRSIYGYYTFAGDRHEDFVGDCVAVLNDGSEWKVHPSDTNKFNLWNINDIVHSRVRTSFYWFKREHKFELFNHSINQTVRVMLVRYPYAALAVTGFQDVEVSRELKVRALIDAYGEVICDSYGDPIYESYWLISYVTYIYLNDGTVWTVKNNAGAFNLGSFVYLSANNTADGFKYFFILGSEREALWTEAIRIF